MDHITPFVKQLLLDLRDTVKDLKKEKKELSAVLCHAGCRVDEQVVEIGELKRLLARKDAEIEGLQMVAKKLGSERCLLRFMLVVILAVVVALMFRN